MITIFFIQRGAGGGPLWKRVPEGRNTPGVIYTLIHIAKFSAKIVLMAKLLQITQIWMILNIQDIWRPGKLKKGQKFFWRPNKGQRWKNPNFHNFFNFLWLIGSKNSFGAIFFITEAIKAKKTTTRPNHRKLHQCEMNMTMGQKLNHTQNTISQKISQWQDYKNQLLRIHIFFCSIVRF